MVVMNTKLPLILLFLSLLALSACLALSSQETEIDPELKTCKHQCQQQQQYSERDKRICMGRCDQYHKMKKEREKEKGEQVRKEREHEMEEKGEQEEEEEGNQFVFGDKQFETRVETEDGRVRVLQKFTENSELLGGIENFRLAVLEAQQHSFVSPHHFDSELIIFTVFGRATVGLVKGDKTEKFNLERGNVMRVPSGTPYYIVNRDENEKLLLANLHVPVSIPGQFEAFYGPGGRDPESVLRGFSWDVLEASLKGHKGSLEVLFGRQKRGGIFRISREEVKSLSKGWGIPIPWPFGGQERGPFKLVGDKPSISNDYGRLYEAGPFDIQTALQKLNLMITFADITNGSMTAPMYNSRAIKIGIVTEGRGRFEMVTPYMSQGRQKKKSNPRYERVSAELRPGVVFVVPAGQPWVTMARRESSLQILCFEVNARENVKLAFAGKSNIVKAMEKKAKELAFNWPSEKVDAMFSREEDFFFPGPQNLEEDQEVPRRADA